MDQVQTTLETMRRRGLILYDDVIKLTNRLSNLNEIGAELQAYATNNFVFNKVVLDVSNKEALPAEKTTVRNTIQEFYFGKYFL